MKIVERFLSGDGFIASDGLQIIDERHNEMVKFMI